MSFTYVPQWDDDEDDEELKRSRRDLFSSVTSLVVLDLGVSIATGFCSGIWATWNLSIKQEQWPWDLMSILTSHRLTYSKCARVSILTSPLTEKSPQAPQASSPLLAPPPPDSGHTWVGCPRTLPPAGGSSAGPGAPGKAG